MEDNQTELENSFNPEKEPMDFDNSFTEEIEKVDSKKEENLDEGQSFETKLVEEDPNADLILGKFKTVEDLKKAYQELQKSQGHSSEELGSLRKEMESLHSFKENVDYFNTIQNEFLEIIERDKEKYSGPEYFQDPTFREIYKEALSVYGADLDTDRMIDLIESYVSMRIQANEKMKLAQEETQNILDSMTYAINPKSTLTPPKKTFDEMTSQEVDELLERLI